MGYNVDHTKATARSTKSNEPVTLDQLANVEENILKQLDILYEKLSIKEVKVDKTTKKD